MCTQPTSGINTKPLRSTVQCTPITTIGTLIVIANTALFWPMVQFMNYNVRYRGSGNYFSHVRLSDSVISLCLSSSHIASFLLGFSHLSKCPKSLLENYQSLQHLLEIS